MLLDGQRVEIKAGVYTLGGYSAHADRQDLLSFVKRMRHKPQHIRIVHGDYEAKRALQRLYRDILPDADVVIGPLLHKTMCCGRNSALTVSSRKTCHS